MVRSAHENVLLIGDSRRDVQRALSQAAPGIRITCVETVFDGIAELSNHDGAGYTTVIAAAEPIERRAESAVRTLRELTPEGKVVLFGDAAHEALGRKMRSAG